MQYISNWLDAVCHMRLLPRCPAVDQCSLLILKGTCSFVQLKYGTRQLGITVQCSVALAHSEYIRGIYE